MRTVNKREVTKLELEQFVAQHQPALTFDGMRYTHPVRMNGLTWLRTVAYIDSDGKCYLIEDA